jgi:hypothetical protein
MEYFFKLELILLPGLLVPVMRFFELDLNRLPIRFDVVPLSVGVPAFGDYLNQYFSSRNWGNFYRPILIGLEIHFRQLVAMEQAARFVVLDVHAGVADGFVVCCHDDAQLGGGRVGRLGFFFILGSGWDGRGWFIGAGLAKARACTEQNHCQDCCEFSTVKNARPLPFNFHSEYLLLYSPAPLKRHESWGASNYGTPITFECELLLGRSDYVRFMLHRKVH